MRSAFASFPAAVSRRCSSLRASTCFWVASNRWLRTQATVRDIRVVLGIACRIHTCGSQQPVPFLLPRAGSLLRSSHSQTLPTPAPHAVVSQCVARNLTELAQKRRRMGYNTPRLLQSGADRTARRRRAAPPRFSCSARSRRRLPASGSARCRACSSTSHSAEDSTQFCC